MSERNALIEAAYRSGDTLATIGRREGLSEERVRQILKSRGVTRGDRPRPDTDAELRRLRALIVDADSYLSLVRHRHLDREFAASRDGQEVIREIDDVIRRLRHPLPRGT